MGRDRGTSHFYYGGPRLVHASSPRVLNDAATGKNKKSSLATGILIEDKTSMEQHLSTIGH